METPTGLHWSTLYTSQTTQILLFRSTMRFLAPKIFVFASNRNKFMYTVNTLFRPISIGFEYLIRSMLTDPTHFILYSTNREHVHSYLWLKNYFTLSERERTYPNRDWLQYIENSSALRWPTILAEKKPRKKNGFTRRIACLFAFGIAECCTRERFR